MGLKDALYLLENLGCRVRFKGKGRIVSQNPKPGTPIDKNTIVELELSDKYEIRKISQKTENRTNQGQ